MAQLSRLERDFERSAISWRQNGVEIGAADLPLIPIERPAHRRNRADHVSSVQAKRERIDGEERHSRTRLIIDGLHVALAAKSDKPFRAWLRLALRWDFIPEASEMFIAARHR